MADDLGALLAGADRALAQQNLMQARELLDRAAAAAPNDLAIRLKLAGICRALGQPRAALDAVHSALAISPLDFTALLMRASLLERMADPEAGEAWGHALAQRPDGTLPPQLAAIVADGERLHADWLDGREKRLQAHMAAAEQKADEEERTRIARFRSNVLRRTKHYHSDPTHYYFPEIAEREFHPRRLFPWLAELEAATETIASELEAVMAAERAELVPYIQYEDYLPLQQWQPLNRSRDWTAIHLLQNGRRIEANARHCPQTMKLLKHFPQPVISDASPNAMFSLLAPNTQIPPHVGINNARLVCHLPLVVPEGCWFRVGAQTRYWKRGEAFVFDDTIEHEALNPTDQLRVVFIFDIWHPDLSEAEREAVAALIGTEGGEAAGGL
ncbi:MAG TPA: aspartyl/asparaginyl beta-hydroxylase domain-containing protein [Allosphingosinicella sp.]|uniref:aspartyl/asparaginyl beta-hydroxylase domain-containing protein n=1 Tax=Allosphingosinicella sp. TaxID=2823234 RepID=UPI002ED9C1E0